MLEQKMSARPYAKAAFEIAKAQKQFDAWSHLLNLLAAIVTNPKIATLLQDKTKRPDEISEFFSNLLAHQVSEESLRFVQLLAERRRLKVLPEIVNFYETLRKEAENILNATVVSATPLADDQKQKIKMALQKRFDCTIEIQESVDPTLLGGFWVKAGNDVIDATLKGQLMQLENTLGGNHVA